MSSFCQEMRNLHTHIARALAHAYSTVLPLYLLKFTLSMYAFLKLETLDLEVKGKSLTHEDFNEICKSYLQVNCFIHHMVSYEVEVMEDTPTS